MSYTVLARKYRSRTFDEIIGQEPIARTLVNAIKTGRIAHGYLFTGTRGSGKTSTARILAKALNCLKFDAPTPTPCGECDACRAIAEGQDIDVVEIDAASNTGVDNIRELRSNTAYRPARSRFKIYIIDEVHMLSTGAFNALLKTLEEPPEHVKFILATTEVQKVPATILSRCQRFNFRNIEPDAIAKRLLKIAVDEKVKLDEAVARRVARLANGSMRDALSILDQLLSVSGNDVSMSLLNEVLPPAQNEQVLRLLACAADGDAAGGLRELDALLSGGRGLEVFCQDAIDTTRTLLLLKACGEATDSVDLPAGERGEYLRLSGQFELSHFVQMIAMLEELRRSVRFSGSGRALTDALVVRICKLRQWASVESVIGALAGGAPVEKKKSLSPVPPPARPPAAPPAIESSSRSVASTAAPPLAARPASSTVSRANEPPKAAVQSRETRHAAASVAPRVPAPAIAVPSPASDGGPDYSDAAEEHAAREAEHSSGGEMDAARPGPARSGERGAIEYIPADAEQRAGVLKHPAVTAALELFDGMVVNVERRVVIGPETPSEAE